MPTDQRRLTGGSTLRSNQRSLARRAVPLASVLVIAALWAAPDSAAAMSFRGFGGPFAGHQRNDGYHAPIRGSRIVRGNRPGTWTGRRIGSNIYVPPRGGDNPPRHPVWPRWPRHPIIGGLPPLPPGPSGVADIPPSGSGPSVPPAGGAGAPPAGVAAVTTNGPFVPDEVLVSFTASVPPQAIVTFAQGQRLALLGVHRLPAINTVLYQFRITDRRAVPAVLGSLQGDARIAAAQPNYVYRLQDAGQVASQAGDSQQYVVAKMHLAEAHAMSTGGHVTIAVIDSAIDTAHPELKGAVAGRFDAIRGTAQPHEHGTAMASAIVAHGRLLGVAPAAHILAVRAFEAASASAESTTTRVVDSLQWINDSGARVVNMSFTGPSDPRMHEMIVASRRKGLVLVAAAGNDGPQAAPDYPAAYPEVIAVTATDMDDKLLPVANRGRYVSVAAPGVEIFVASPNGQYGFTTGTSVATAHVSGLAALLIDRNPSLTPDQIQAILMRTAHDLGAKGRDDEYGAGLVDAYEALLSQAPATADSTR